MIIECKADDRAEQRKDMGEYWRGGAIIPVHQRQTVSRETGTRNIVWKMFILIVSVTKSNQKTYFLY